jgi:hypothetical protein
VSADYLEAIQSVWTDSSLSLAVSDHRLHLIEASIEVQLPYAVLLPVSGAVTADLATGSQVLEPMVQLGFHATTLEEAWNLAERARALYHRASLAAAQPILACLAGEIRLEKGDGFAPGGQESWFAYLELELITER